MRHVLIALTLVLTGCQLEPQSEMEATASRWVNIDEVLDFTSHARCTAAALRLTNALMPNYVVPAGSAERAIHEIEQGRVVALQITGRTPHQLSSTLMSQNLSRGLGLVGSVTGAADCMTGAVEQLTRQLVHTPDALTIFDPSAFTVLIIDFEQRLAVYLRTSA